MRVRLLLECGRVLVLARQIVMRINLLDRHTARAVSLLLAFLSTAVFALDVKRTERQALLEVDYEVATNDCVIAWTVRRFAHSEGFGLSEQSRCDTPLPNQAEHRSALLKSVVAEHAKLAGLRNFAWGRLQRADATAEFAARMQRTAAQSPHWNNIKGRPARASDGAGRVVQSLLNKHRVFAEIVEVFAAQGFKLEVNSVEKIIVGTTGVGALPALRLPLDAQVTFSVKSMAAPS